MNYLLGLDIGTSGTKVMLFDAIGRPLASHTEEYPLLQPRNGWAEQNPEDWWRACVLGIRAVLSAVPDALHETIAVGLSGQMHGLVMLDGSGSVLRPAILWCDGRTDAERAWMEDKIGNETLIRITGNPAMASFTAAKILWVRKNEPSVYAKCRHILLPKDYIRFRLTGEYATEVSDASGMQLMDVGRRVWSDELLSKLSVDKALLGTMYESPNLTGTVSVAASAQTGLAVGSPVAGGAGDNPASAIAAGAVREGNALFSLGTSAVIYTVTDALHCDQQGRIHSLCASVPGKWTVMSCTQSAGLSLRWFRDTCCGEEKVEAARTGTSVYDLMTYGVENIPAGADRLLFLPYLMGERSPHPDADCRGVFFGLSAMHGKAHLVRAVLEGVSYSQRECLEVFREMKVPVSSLIACGGGSNSPVWMRILSAVCGCSVTTLRGNEGGALGAALLAGIGTGAFRNAEEASSAVVVADRVYQPENSDRYEPFYRIYRELYQTLKGSFARLAGAGQ